MIRLRTLGESIIEVDGVSYTPQYDTLFAALVYLTAERGRRVQRDTLAQLLWPRHEVSKGRHCLRQLLYRMRTAGCPVEGGRDTLLLPDGLVMPTFSAAPAAERLVAERAAGTLVIGPFLPGYVPPFSDALVEWLERTRAALDARVRRVLIEVAHAHKLRGEWDQVDVVAAEVLRIDPLNEEATLARAEATAMVGAKTEAVAMLDRYMAELGPDRAQLQLPAAILRKRIAERFPTRRYGGASEHYFVGRSDTMERLSTALLRARKGEGSGILLTGAPGIGKTRLLQELTKVATMQGVRVTRANVTEPDAERPLSAFADLVPQLRTLKGAIGVDPESLGFLDRLTESGTVSSKGDEDTRDPRWIASRLRQAIVDICDAVTAESTVLLIVDDVHWLDSSSWSVVDALIRSIASRRLLVLLSARTPYAASAMPQRCTEQLQVHRVEALNEAAATAYARAIASDYSSQLADETVDSCISVGEGNPLLIREIVTHALEPSSTGSVPYSLQGLLDARIGRLGSAARRVLEAAALLGEFSNIDLLHSVLELPAHELAGALAELSSERLLDEDSIAVLPRHELVKQRVVDAMPAHVRLLLHTRIAARLSDERGTSLTVESLLAAATHWQAANRASEAVRTLSAASLAVMRLGAIAETIRLLRAALRFAPPPNERLTIERRLLRCLALDAKWTEARTFGLELSQLDGWIEDRDAATADALIALEAEFRTDEDPLPLLDRASLIAGDTSIAPGIRLNAARLGLVIATNAFRIDQQSALWNSISDIRDHPLVDQLELLSMEVIVEANVGDMHRAIELAKRLFALASNEEEPKRQLTAITNAAQAHFLVGLYDCALPLLLALYKRAQAVGSLYYEMAAADRIAQLFVEQRRPDSARDWLERVARNITRVTGPLHLLALTDNLARLALLESRLDEAYERALALRSHVQSIRHPLRWTELGAITTLVEVLLHRQSGVIDLALVEELERMHEATQESLLHDRTVAVLAESLRRNGEHHRADRIVADYVKGHRRSLVPWSQSAFFVGPAEGGSVR